MHFIWDSQPSHLLPCGFNFIILIIIIFLVYNIVQQCFLTSPRSFIISFVPVILPKYPYS